MVSFFKLFLIPFSLLYGIVVYVRNRMFDYNLLSSKGFKIPIIVVGNLTTGGTGKTPHTEYLIQLLKDKYKVAVLSRGYGRSTKKFIESDSMSKYTDIGDEPMQMKNKFKDVIVTVDKKRTAGIAKILQKHPDIDIILLDDAFQHRWLKPGMSILLTDYSKPYWKNFLLPYGTLREQSSETKRADIIIATKTPVTMSPIERRILKEEINPRPYQEVFLSFYKYGNIVPYEAKSKLMKNIDLAEKKYDVVLFTGIAHPEPLYEHLENMGINVTLIRFADHHNFSKYNLMQVKKAFDDNSNSNKIVLTTEKDSTRLDNPVLQEVVKGIPLYYIPVSIGFHDDQEEIFQKAILGYVRKTRVFEEMKS